MIISPPFHGKTTFARDLGKQYSERLSINTLFIDERDEFSLGNSCDLGKCSDVIRYCDKKFGFYNGVRVMNPEVIVCDELSDESDFDGLNFAANSGVKVVATIHGDDLCDITKKEEGKRIIENKIFDYFVVLLNFKVYKIYDKNMRLL